MNNPFEEIFMNISDQQEVVNSININLRPILQGRKESGNGEEYFRKLSVCLGYQIKKVEVARSIILTYFKHNVIKKGLDKNGISTNVEGIISSESGMDELIETARAFYGETLFNSQEQRDASYLMASMKLIIESSLLIGFIEYISNKKQGSFLSYPYDKLVDVFNKTLAKHVGTAFQEVMKSM